MNNPNYIDAFENSLQQANRWLDLLAEKYDLASRQQAYNILRTVLQALRERLPDAGIAVLSAQLPLILRGVFMEGWTPGKPEKLHVDEFCETVARNIKIDRYFDGLIATQAVLQLLDQELAPGTIEKLLHLLPSDFRSKLTPWHTTHVTTR